MKALKVNRKWLVRALAFAILLFATPAFAQVPSDLNISGGLFDASGTPLTASNVNFQIQILDKNGTCVLYSEQHLGQDLSSTKGAFSLQIGSGTSPVNNLEGTMTFDSGLFQNKGATGAFAGCGAGVTFLPGDSRVVRVSYEIGTSGYVTMTPDVSITSAPYSMIAQTLQGKTPANFILTNVNAGSSLNQASVENIFSTTNYTALLALLGGASSQYVANGANGAADLPTIAGNPASPALGQMWYDATNNVVKYYNGSTVQTVAGAGGGLTSITAGTGLTGGTIVSSGTISVDVGTGANKIVQLNGSAQLPAVDGSLLTNVNSSKLATRSVASTAPGSGQVLMWNVANSDWEPSTSPGINALHGDVSAVGPGNVNATITNNAVNSSAKIAATGIGVNQLLITDATTGTTLTYAICTPNQVLQWTATGWACTNVSNMLGSTGVVAGTYGSTTQVAKVAVDSTGRVTSLSNVNIAFPVTSVAGRTGAVALNAADIGGLGTAATQDYGVAPNNLVQLGATSNLPAVDGSLLTNVNATSIQGRSIASTAPSGGQTLTWNATDAQWEPTSGSTAGFVNGGNIFGGNSTLGNQDNYSLSFLTNNTARMLITANGNVGIGTTSPLTTLMVSSGQAGGSQIIVNNPNVSPIRAAISLYNQGTAKWQIGNDYNQTGVNDFFLYDNSQSQPRLYVGTTGNVGIGTTSPANSLDIGNGGGIHITTGVPGSTAAALYNNSGTLYWNGLALSTATGSYVSTSGGSMSGGLTISSGGESLSGGLNNNSGGISNAGSLTGVGNNITGSGALSIAAGGAGQNLMLSGSGSGAVLLSPNVGIGTTSPGYPLDVNGIERATTHITSSLGIPSNVAFGVNGQTNGMFSPTTNMIALSTAGVERLRVDNSGNVGIGTASPSQALEVNGNVLVDQALTVNFGMYDYSYNATTYTPNGASIPQGQLELYNPANTTGDMALVKLTPQNNNSHISAYFGAVMPASGNSPAIVLGQQTGTNSFAERMRIDVTGNVGIGTTSPSSILAVGPSPTQGQFNITIPGGTFGADAVINSTWQNNGFHVKENSNSVIDLMGSAASNDNGQLILYNGGAAKVSLVGSGVSYINGGNVGIGTTSPGASLDVESSGTYALKSVTNATNGYGVFAETIGNGGIALYGQATGTNGFALYSAGGTNYFSDNVGIGTSLPASILDVNGTGSLSAMIVPRDTTANRPTAAVNGMIRYNTSAAAFEGYANGSWGALGGSGGSTFASDVTMTGAGTGLAVSNTAAVGGNLTVAGAAVFNGGINGGAQNITNIGAGILGSGAMSVAAGGFNQNLTLSGSGTGQVLLTPNVGIGTTSAQGLLDVYSTASSTHGLFVSSAGNVGIGTTSPGYLFTVGSSGKFTVDGSGNVQANFIQSQTSSNAAYLSSSSSAVIPAGGFVYKASNSYAQDGDLSGILFLGQNTAGNQQNAYFGSYVNSGSSSYTPTLVIGQQTGANSYAERLRIDQNGNVGIGTTSPSASLEVNGGITADGALWSKNSGAYFNSWVTTAYTANSTGIPQATLNLFNPSNTTGGMANILLQPTTQGGGTATVYLGAINPSSGNAPFVIGQQTGASTYAERLRIDASGNVGIGTTSPANTLDIGNGGGIHITSGVPTSTTAALYNNAGTLYWNGSALGGGGSYVSNTGGSMSGGLTIASGGLNVAGGIAANSGSITGVGSNITGAGAISIAAGGTNQNLMLSGSGTGSILMNPNVGIGTATANYPLDIVGNGGSGPTNAVAQFTNGISDTILRVNNTGGHAWALDSVGSGSSQGSAGAFAIVDESASQTVRLSITPTGLVAVGTGNTAAKSALDVGANGLAVGSYAGYNAAPSNGAIISGNVGIGTTSPAGTLDVEGGTASSGNGTNINIVAQNGHSSGTTAGGIINLVPGAGYGGGLQGGVVVKGPSGGIGNLAIATSDFSQGATGSLLQIATGAATGNTFSQVQALTAGGTLTTGVLSLNPSGGNVGIGTASPSKLFSVGSQFTVDSSGNSNAATYTAWNGVYVATNVVNAYAPTGSSGQLPLASGGSQITIDNYATIANNTAMYQMTANNSSGPAQSAYVGISAASSGYAPNMVFGTSNGSASYTERMRIDQNGNVGIGTNSPGTALDINGGLRAGSSTIVTATCNSINEGIQRYNYTTHFMEYCNGTAWSQLIGQAVGSTANALAVGPPVSANAYSFTSVLADYTPSGGAAANTDNGVWLPANANSSACLVLPNDAASYVQYDLGSNNSIGHIYIEGTYAPTYTVYFSTDGINFSNATTLTIPIGNWQQAVYLASAVNPVQTARYIRVMNSSNDPSGTGTQFCQVAVGP